MMVMAPRAGFEPATYRLGGDRSIRLSYRGRIEWRIVRFGSGAPPNLRLDRPRREALGGAEGSRTPDLDNANVALSQLSYGPALFAARSLTPASPEYQYRRRGASIPWADSVIISVIIPAFNETSVITATLRVLQPLRAHGHEVIVVDGGSRDGTPRIAAPFADRVLVAPRGRARQMNAGAAVANGAVLWFLHADTLAPADAAEQIARAGGRGYSWGRFDVRLSSQKRLLRLVAWAMNRRSCLSGIATGDQGLFVERLLFKALGGYPDQPLMEDVELSRRLKRYGRPACLLGPIVTSARRWERNGVWATIALMWCLRLAYFCGADARMLQRRYERSDSPPRPQRMP